MTSRKHNKPLHPLLNMTTLNINEVTSHKHLGLICSDDGSWHEHIDHVKAKSCSRLNIMRKLKFQLDRKSLEILYTSFIDPFLNIPMLSGRTALNMNRKTWIKTKLLTEATQLTSLQSLYIETGWEALLLDDKNQSLTSFIK